MDIPRPSNGPATPQIEYGADNPFGPGYWVARFDAQYMPRVAVDLFRMAITGPVGSQLAAFVDGRYQLSTTLASLNSWSGTPIRIDPGQPLTIYWNTAAAPRPAVSLYLRTVGHG